MADRISNHEQLWKEWIKEKNDANANRLIEYYMYLVNYHVQRISSTLPKNINKDDIRSLGLVGLYDALMKFDYDRDLKFDTYASFRIKGAILDGLRKEDWLPRSTRDKVKKIEKMREHLEQNFQREATVEEIAKYLDLTVEEVEEAVKDSFFSNLLSMEEKKGATDDTSKEGIGYNVQDNKNLSPEEQMIQTEDFKELAEAIKNLSKNEQLVLSLFYQQELTFTEIGKVLQLTTSRISQVHKQAIFKVKGLLIN